MVRDSESRTVQSVRTATTIIDHIRNSTGARVTELAEQTGLSPGAVHTQLTTLKEAGFVVQRGDTYHLGPQLLTLGEYVRNHSDLYQASKDKVEDLATRSGEAAHLIIEHDGKLFALYERFGSEAVGVEFHDRKRERPLDHLHCTAAGKAILARLPKEETDRILSDSGLPEVTDQTITDRDRLSEELSRIRDRGYALNDQEQIDGIRAVGAPIVGTDGRVAGAIAVSGPTSRLRSELFREELPEMVMRAANICEIDLQSPDVGEA